MLYDYNNYNNFNWFQKNTKDSFKYTEKLSKLGAKIQSLSDKINNLKDIKIEVTEKSLDNNEKTFTLKVVGNLNLSNKGFIKEIAEQFASILDDYKTKKIEELSKELDGTIEDMKNVFPEQITIFSNGVSSGIVQADPNGKTWIGDGKIGLMYCSQSDSIASVQGSTFNGDILNENRNDGIKTAIDWKID